jgi:hypothetical protein
MKKITTLGILGLVCTAVSVQAQVNIYITGSTAFRASMFRAITNLYGANLQNENPGGTTANNSGANQVTYGGLMSGVFGSQQVTIYTSMSGSIAGVQTLAQNLTPTFFNSPTNGDATTVNHQADLAFSDVYQAATGYQTPALADLLVAVQPFAFTKSVSSPARLTNITHQQIQPFFANGFIPLSYFTGNTNDSTTNCYLPGRSIDSGTRLTAEYDSFFAPGGVEQPYAPNVSGVWSPSVGYSSGSGVRGALNQANAGPAIGYLGIADAMVVNNGSNNITYNGALPYLGTLNTGTTSVTGTNDYTPVIKGQYSYWSYEHLFERTSVSPGSSVDLLRSNLSTHIDLDIATVYPKVDVRLSEMQVSRPADGGPITP